MEIKIKEDKQSYLILTEDDILAIDKGEVKWNLEFVRDII
jgi:uncharacterized beta-barrel protein YwiB (DUF1934 family)